MAPHVLLIAGHRQRCNTKAHGACKVLTLMQVQQLIMCGKFPPARMSDLASIGQHPGATGDAFPSAKGRS